MGTIDQPDLLFLDTFSHDTNEELNLDLVQFPKSVYVREIRIIPLGARVEGDFPGGVRLGATNPTKFHIDFFVNDLSKPGASTFEAIGSLDYCQNGQIHMECSSATDQTRIPTDGLVLRGWYTTITLAVYGNLTQVISEPLPVVNPPPQVQRQGVPPQEVAPVIQDPPPVDWIPEASNPIPTYTGNVATTNPEAYAGAYPSENYDPPIYRGEYYEAEPPKDPRSYHQEDDWDKRRHSVEREPERRLSPRSIELDRDRRHRLSRSRSPRRRDRSLDRRDLRSKSRSLDRDYVVKGEYRPLSRSRSRSVEPRERLRGLSADRDWERSSYKREDYRRHRDSSYDRSPAGSYDKRSGSFDRRSPYDKRRTPSYDRKSYEKRAVSPYDRATSYERRGTSYEKQSPYDKKRHSPYRRVRGSSYGSRSPSRDDPRKRPRSPLGDRRPLSPRDVKASPARSEDEYDRSGKIIPRVEFYHQSYRHKSCIRSPSQEPEAAPYIEPQHPSLVTVKIVDNPPVIKSESPDLDQEDDKSMEAEQFEPILSDEDICDDIESASYMDVDYESNDYGGTDDIIKYFNPFKSEWKQYENVNKVHLLATEKRDGVKDVMTATFDELCDVNSDLFKIYEITRTAKGREQKFIYSTFTEIDNIAKEEWVHQCEQIFIALTNLCRQTDIILRIFNDQPKVDDDEFTDIFDLLITFCKIGLNFDYALAHQQPTYKIRHMKCGIRLSETLLNHKYNGQVMKLLLEERIDVPMLLLQMYAKEYMALSIRLMILKSLNACLASKESVEHFMKLAMYPIFIKNQETNERKNGYQALISIMQSNPLARIKFSISALIKKMNMYELLAKLFNTVNDFNRRAAETKQADNVELSEDEVEFIVSALEEIVYMYRCHCFHISQPKRFLPVSAQFDINKDCSNKILLQFFEIHHTLEACLFLLTCPSTCNNLVIISPIHDFIHELIYSENGLNFLYNNMLLSELLFKTLMHPYGHQNTDDFICPLYLTNYTDLQVLGLELAYRLKCLYYLHSIFDLQAGKFDENELTDRLQALYCLTFGSIGKIAVPDVIGMGDNAECLLEVFEKCTKIKTKSDSPQKQRSPAKGYTVELIVNTVRFSSNVQFLKKYGTRLLNIAKEHDRFEPSVSSVLQELIPYLNPIEKPGLLSGDDMAECIEILKATLEHAADVPGELMTCLRILKHYCISDYDANVTIASESATEEYVELKYKYNVLQLFSLDGVANLTAILERFVTRYEQPSVHSATFVLTKGLQIAQMIIPCLKLVDDMLARVVKSRGSSFRDMTAAPILLKTFGLLKAFPEGCVGYRTAMQAAEATVKALLAYSQPIADDANDGDSIKNGPWTSLCGNVISYTMTAPYTFVSGLSVFSEILPLPLPMQTKIPPTERELADAANERRLWSAHLHVLANDLTDLVQVICMSTYRPVVHLLRRVCVQIADLAPNTASTIAKAAIGAVTRELKPGEAASGSLARVLSFLACLVAHAPVKSAVLHLMNTQGPNTTDLQNALVAVLTFENASNEHGAAQEYAAHALAGLCDAEVTLTPLESPVEVILANSLPNKESLQELLEASSVCLDFPTKTCTVASSVLRTFFVLTEYEFGFLQFRKFVTKKREALGKFFKWCLEGTDDGKMECLNLYVDLIKILRIEEGEGPMGRKSVLNLSEMADMVGFNVGDTEHPVLNLENLLKERNLDDEAVGNAHFLVTHLHKLVETCEEAGATPPPPEHADVTLPAPDSLVVQWAGRSCWSSGCAGDERLGAGYWLLVRPAAPDPTPDLVSVCVLTLSRSCGVSAGSTSAAGWLPAALAALTHSSTPAQAQAGDLSAGRGLPPPAPPPAADSFRSRPPNTSRPPSLHVDHFTQLHHNNRVARRGASGASGGAERGRFLAPHPHYRHFVGRGGGGAWDGSQHFGHFTPHYNMGGMGWGGGRMQRGPRHRAFMR